MIPVVYTKKHFLQIRNQNGESNMQNSTLLYSAEGQLFTVQRTELVTMPTERRSDLRFEVEAHEINHEQHLFIGLMETEKFAVSDESSGLAVSICPGEGTLTDLINGTGVIGYFDEAPFAKGEVLKISIEIDIVGKVCIPKIAVNGEVILTPGDSARDVFTAQCSGWKYP